MIKNNKGEISSSQLVLIIILILSFVILIIYLSTMNFQVNLPKQICHNSVVIKATAIAAQNELKSVAPLNCKTQYTCLSEDGTCESMTSPIIKKVKNKEQAYKILAEEMADCWWMFGEGEVDYMGKTIFGGKTYCSLCNQVKFDDSLKGIPGFESGEIDTTEFYEYLFLNKLDDKNISYGEYLYPLIKSEDTNYKDAVDGNVNKDILTTLKGIEPDSDPVIINYNNIFDVDILSQILYDSGILDFLPEEDKNREEKLKSFFDKVNNKNLFTRVSLDDLKAGDIVFITEKCENNPSKFKIGVVKSIESNSIKFYLIDTEQISPPYLYYSYITDLDKSNNIFSNEFYIYQAFRYTKGLPQAEINSIEYEPKSLDGAWEMLSPQINSEKNLIKDNYGLFHSFFVDELIIKEQCDGIRKNPDTTIESVAKYLVNEETNKMIISNINEHLTETYNSFLYHNENRHDGDLDFQVNLYGEKFFNSVFKTSGIFELELDSYPLRELEDSNLFTRVSLNNLQPGDVVYITSNCFNELSFDIGIVKDSSDGSYNIYLNNPLYLHKEYNHYPYINGFSVQSFDKIPELVLHKDYIYKAFRYTQGLSTEQIKEIEYIPSIINNLNKVEESINSEKINFSDNPELSYLIVTDDILEFDNCSSIVNYNSLPTNDKENFNFNWLKGIFEKMLPKEIVNNEETQIPANEEFINKLNTELYNVYEEGIEPGYSKSGLATYKGTEFFASLLNYLGLKQFGNVIGSWNSPGEKMWSIINNKILFTRVSLNKLEPGDIVFIRRENPESLFKKSKETCLTDPSIFIVGIVKSSSPYGESTKITVYLNNWKDYEEGDEYTYFEKTFEFPYDRIDTKGHIYQAFRYTEGLNEEEINKIKYTPMDYGSTWSYLVNNHFEENSDENSDISFKFLANLVFDGVLDKESCEELINPNLYIPYKKIDWLKNKLLGDSLSNVPFFLNGEKFEPIYLDKTYFIAMGIVSQESNLGKIIKGGIAGATAAVVTLLAIPSGGMSFVAGLALLKAGTIMGVASNYLLAPVFSKGEQMFIGVSLIEEDYTDKTNPNNAFYCTDYVTIS